MQASLLAAAARTAEVSALKQDLKWSEDELGLTKRQLEESKGKIYPYLFVRCHDLGGDPEEGVVRGRRQSSHRTH